ncbi:hypothetical protein [Microvirga massiliensis]|uniref:hypothetical protein n=1 Tax=Microvirga massiliensis TaxID=1033741 RepID=UPI00062B99FF|nr:hypothetical protein [Microvirga massiliensis]
MRASTRRDVPIPASTRSSPTSHPLFQAVIREIEDMCECKGRLAAANHCEDIWDTIQALAEIAREQPSWFRAEPEELQAFADWLRRRAGELRRSVA